MSDSRVGLFDMDGTLADYEKAMRKWLDLMKGPDEPDYPVHSREPAYVFERHKVARRQPGYWLGLEPIAWGFDVLRAAQAVGFTNFHACTKGPHECPNAWSEKKQWIDHYIAVGRLPPDMKLTITEDKSTVYGRFLVEDFVPYLAGETVVIDGIEIRKPGWLDHRPRGLGILILNNDEARQFVAEKRHPNVIGYDGTNYDEIQDALARAFSRKQGEELF